MRVNLQLMILSISHQPVRALQLLISNKKIPSTILTESDDVNKLLSGLMEEYIEIHSTMYQPKLLDIIKNENDLSVIYGVMVPDFIKIIHGGWTPIEELIKDEEIERYIGYVYKII